MPFTKGHKIVGNRNGRPAGSRNKVSQKLFDDFLKTIKEVEDERKADKRVSEEGKTLFKHIINRGFKNDTVGIALLKKLVPDQVFNIEDLQNANIKVTFELVDTKSNKVDEKISEAEIVQVLIDNNQNDGLDEIE